MNQRFPRRHARQFPTNNAPRLAIVQSLAIVALVALLVLVIGSSVTGQTTTEPAQSSESATATVHLIVDYGDGHQKHYTQLPWHEDLTVWGVMERAIKHPRGIKVKHRGKGATLLVLQIDDVANEAGTARNWIYRVNDEVADRSAGIREVKPNDTILWRFETYR
jgi:hypothetical protein